MPAKQQGERLQKVLAHAGVGSRRACEEMILAGRVAVNGLVVTELGTRVNPAVDSVMVDGKPVGLRPRRWQCYALYKPSGYITSVRDPHGRRTARDLVPTRERLYPVGRLDYDSEGLLLWSNDGELALRLTHPRYAHEKEYLVLVRGGRLSEAMLNRLRDGISLPDAAGGVEAVARAEASLLPPTWVWRGQRALAGTFWMRVVLRQGLRRQIRRMLETLGCTVQRLIRLRMSIVTLGDLEPEGGRWLDEGEVNALRRAVGLPSRQATERSRSKGAHLEQDHYHYRRPRGFRQKHRRRDPRR